MTKLSILALALLALSTAATAAPIPMPGIAPPPPAAAEPAPETTPAPAPAVPAVQPDHPSDTAAAACAERADSLNNVVPGISHAGKAQRQGDFWVITVTSGSFHSLCTVSRNGQVMDIVSSY